MNFDFKTYLLTAMLTVLLGQVVVALWRMM
jgi:hypothetical protein